MQCLVIVQVYSNSFCKYIPNNGCFYNILNLPPLLCRYNETVCLEDSVFYSNHTHTFESACRYWHDGSGLTYQVLAGPVFNNVYIVAGVLMGFLADFGNRKVFLVLSLVLWSVATGLTGFATHYWHLVLLRALLAIG